jgi:release factor glutamine methyltransferase
VTILEVIQRSTEFLGRKGVDSPRLQIELLLAHVLKTRRLQLYLEPERTLDTSQLEMLRGLVKRRGEREPLQHILGSTSFCGLEIEVTPDTLIPRPETEMLAEKAWLYLQGQAPAEGQAWRVLDWGTGSGCLAIAIASHCPQVEVHALDISPKALRIAQANAAFHRLPRSIIFHEGDGFAALPVGLVFDLIVSNPPYIPSAEIEQLSAEVRDHDPRLALDGGADGLDFYRRLSVEAPDFLVPQGGMMLELGDHQAEAIRSLMTVAGWRMLLLEEDYSHKPRVMLLSHCADPQKVK